MSKKMSYATDLTLHSRPEWPNNSFSILCIAPYICYASQAILSALNFVILFIAKIQTVFVKNAYGNQLQRTHLCLQSPKSESRFYYNSNLPAQILSAPSYKQDKNYQNMVTDFSYSYSQKIKIVRLDAEQIHYPWYAVLICDSNPFSRIYITKHFLCRHSKYYSLLYSSLYILSCIKDSHAFCTQINIYLFICITL